MKKFSQDSITTITNHTHTHTHTSLGIKKKFNFHFDLIHHNHIDAIIRFKNPDMMMAMAIENELNVYELGKNCSFIP